MATTPTTNETVLKAGLLLNVRVENAIDGVVMVCLRHEGRTLRGILLDSEKGSCPVGMPNNDILRRDLNDKFGVPENEVATIEADVVRRDPHSALSYRQSYFQNMLLPPPRPLLCGMKIPPSSKPKLGPSYTTRSRPLKLRPRRMLCSKCKQDCSKKDVAKRSKQFANGPKKKSHLDPLKKRATHDLKKARVQLLKKTLKISYATPQGKDHLTISPRSSSGNDKRQIYAHENGGKKPTAISVQNEKLDEGTKHAKQNGKHRLGEKRKMTTVNGFHPGHKNPRPSQWNDSSAMAAKPANRLSPLRVPRDKEKENSLSEVASKEVIANGLKLHLVQDLFVPCPKGKGIVSDTSSESSCASSVSSKWSRRSRPANSGGCAKQSGLSDSEREIEFTELPDRSDVLSDSNENWQPKRVPPLNLKIHKKNVTKYKLQDGRTMCLGDIVWGKIIGFPWWPGRISQIVVSRRDNGVVLQQEAQIRWLGATTISLMPLEKLYPFLPYFKERYNKKRKGLYKNAISQAMEEAKSATPEVRELNTMFETSQIC